MATLKVLKALG